MRVKAAAKIPVPANVGAAAKRPAMVPAAAKVRAAANGPKAPNGPAANGSGTGNGSGAANGSGDAKGPRVAKETSGAKETAARVPAAPGATAAARVPAAAKVAAPGQGSDAAESPAVDKVGDAAPLTEEERIESSKYDSRERRPRAFEEERFLFPETYDADRVRLLVKDPEWLFAHWDVSPRAYAGLRAELGERALALSRLTLRLEDPADGVLSVVLLPEGVRSWYLRTHPGHRTYRAELGFTTPAGGFRSLATSNVVVTPRVGPSHERAARRVSIHRQADAQAEPQPLEPQPAPAHPRAKRGKAKRPPIEYIDGARETPPQPAAGPAPQPQRGGASDVFGPAGGGAVAGAPPGAGETEGAPGPGGASDVFRPAGASDVFRR